jgi:oxygen-dependent protoporphyrinogen oxidase
MRIAVVGAGAAGLTAAYRLQQQGHDVVVLEREAVPGGRTHSEHFGPGHWSDTGAGWLASFYPRTLALLDELGLGGLLKPLPLRGGGDLLLDGRLIPFPSSLRRILQSHELGAADRARFLAYMAKLFATQRGDLAIDVAYDDVGALDELLPVGTAARDRIVRPLFEGPFFSRLDEMSALLLRSWLRVLSVGQFFQVDGGTDAPWRRIGDLVDVRTATSVRRVARDGTGVVVQTDDGAEHADGCVVAVPAPVAASLVEGAPPWLGEVPYAPHVRLYAARRAAGPARSSIHVFPNEFVATVEIGAGRSGSWGQVPDDWCWALVCAPAAGSGPLLDRPADEVTAMLWERARRIDPRLFRLESADVVHLIRWERAVPVVGLGYFRRVGALHQEPPIVYAGDWLVQPCVEGAVRSGEAAALVLSGERRSGAAGHRREQGAPIVERSD